MTAASCEISRRRRASPHSRYSGSDSTSRATNSVTVSVAAGKTIIPPIANSASGKTSVCIGAADPGGHPVPRPSRPCAAAWVTNAPPGSDTRSAISSTDGRASTSSTPHMT